MELPSFDKEEHDCKTDFERWIYVLKHMDTLQRLPFKAQKSVFDELEKIVDIASMTKEEREKYDESIRIFRDNKAIARGQHERGFAEGVKKGYDEGKFDDVMRMKSKGVSNEMIAEFTGLSIEEINSITL